MLHIFVFALLAQREGKPKRAARAEASDYGSMALAAKAATKEAEEVALSSGLPHGWSVIQVRSACHGLAGCACRDIKMVPLEALQKFWALCRCSCSCLAHQFFQPWGVSYIRGTLSPQDPITGQTAYWNAVTKETVFSRPIA
jgi:hypothetical protein